MGRPGAVLLTLAALVAAATSEDGLDWWQKKPIYQIYPGAYKDTNGNGYGDINGIREKVDYIKGLGVGAVWMSPMYPSPMWDNGYDISDFTAISQLYGSMDDFTNLVKELNDTSEDKRVRVLMDFVPNHSSDKHQWFIDSENRTGKCDDCYVWRDGKGDGPPNNWQSIFGGSAWTYSKIRKQWYYHAFGEHQPDLNYRSKNITENMKQVLKFWLDKGAFGFRMDAVPYLVEDEGFKDEPLRPGCTEPSWNCLQHIYVADQDDTFNVLADFRSFLDSYNGGEKGTRVMIVEATSPPDKIMNYYSFKDKKVAHMPFNFNLLSLNKDSIGKDYVDTIKGWLESLKDGKWTNWLIGNHDNSRVGTRMGEYMIDAMNMINILLPGTPIIYYGEEIGMTDTYIRANESRDPQGRDPERTPMQWDNTKYAGFSKQDQIWLPVNPNYWKLNLKEQEKGDGPSHYKVFKKLVELKHKIVPNATYNVTDFNSKYQFGILRNITDNEKYLIVININDQMEKVNISQTYDKYSVPIMYVHTTSINSMKKPGDKVDPNEWLDLLPGEGVVLGNVLQSGSTMLTLSFTLLLAALAINLW